MSLVKCSWITTSWPPPQQQHSRFVHSLLSRRRRRRPSQPREWMHVHVSSAAHAQPRNETEMPVSQLAQFHSRITPPPPPRSEISDFSRTTQWKSMRATAPDLRQCAHVPRCERDASCCSGCCVFSALQQQKAREFTLFSQKKNALKCAPAEHPLYSHTSDL